MRGELSPLAETQRYWKFVWLNLDALPPIGRNDYQPKGGAFRMFEEGKFIGEVTETFSAVKINKKLKPFGICIFCGSSNSESGKPLKLTSEHVIPDFLGAGLEVTDATCFNCQKVTSKFESSIAQKMFDPVRKEFNLKGKSGVLAKTNFPLDVGRETSHHEFIPLVHYPTILVMPMLYPASSYSRRHAKATDPFNFRMYNINASSEKLRKYSLDSFSCQSIDLARFSQLIAKIAHVYAMSHLDKNVILPIVADLIRTDFQPATLATGYFENVGCLWQSQNMTSKNLHEIELGKMIWGSETFHAVRVCLFACFNMPSYYVTVGKVLH